jgi:uncharacterized protein (TIRG00374 family)
MIRGTPSGRLRFLVGAALGLALLVATIVQVNLESALKVAAGASPLVLALAVAVVLVDLGLRALRWQILLRGTQPAGSTDLRLAVAYLSIGYLANQLLPARMGDVARAYLAGQAFAVSRLTALGTIMVERVADGATMLGLAIVSGMIVAGVTAVQTLVVYGLLLGVAGLLGMALAWWLMAKTPLASSRIGQVARGSAARLWTGMNTLRTLRGALAVGGTTLAALTTATLVAWLVTHAVGVTLTPVQAALFVSGIALSMAIPAAPGSLGTYEFVGVVVLTALGFAPDRAFAAVILLRIVTTLPPIILGLVAAWALHLRQATLTQPKADVPSFAAPGEAS